MLRKAFKDESYLFSIYCYLKEKEKGAFAWNFVAWKKMKKAHIIFITWKEI